jgi:hypothetical protein
MGGPNPPDDLTRWYQTQAWLATSDDAAPCATGGYWKHQRRHEPHSSARDGAFQQRLLDALASETGVTLPSAIA